MRWKTKTKSPRFQSNFLTVNEEVQTSDKNEDHSFYTIDTSDWISVFALTQKKELVCIKVFRHGTKSEEIEVPAGIVEKDDQTSIRSAIRELEEETGYISQNWIHIGTFFPNPAFMTNKCSVFLAKDAKKSGKINLDDTESISVMLLPVNEFDTLIKNGQIKNAMTLAGFHIFQSNFQSLL